MSSFKNRFSSIKKAGRKAKITAKTGIKKNRNISQKVKVHRDARARKRAEYLSTLPKNPVKRFFYRLSPRNLSRYFTTRDGAISLLKALGIGLAVFMVLMLSMFAYFRKDLPKNIDNLKTCSKGASTLYYDRTGKTLLWASSGDVECYPVPSDQISKNLKNAVIAIEDKNFYKHGGFSLSGVLRAGINNLQGKSTQGGSTITQQFIKNSELTQDRNVIRKAKELVLAIELERSYTKDEILNAYLNEISFGSVYDGAEAASRGYFGKPAKDLTLDEAATLAAVIPAPSYYSPYGENPKELIGRRNYVLDLMVDQGYVKKKDAEAAKKVETLAKLVPKRTKYKDIIAPHFVLETQARLEKEYGATNIRKAGFKVITTVDLRLQKIAEEVVAKNMYRIENSRGDNAALVAVDVATNQVLTMVGSRDFTYPGFGELNVAATPRSPGSSFKPYDYAALMTHNKNFGAGSIFYDINTDFGYGYRPKDYDFREPGAMPMRNALGGSRNIPAIKAMYIAGVQNTIDVAKKLGVVSGTSCEPDCGLSAAIGDGSEIRLDEHVSGFASFARGGKYKPLTYYLKIQDKKGKTIKEFKDTPGQQVIDPQVAYIIQNMMSDGSVRYSGLDYQVRINGVTTAVKTGTTNNSDNGWLMGYSTKLAAGVWIGQHENKTLSGFMEQKTSPIWREFFQRAHEGVAGAGDTWQKPAGIKTVCINPITGYATSSGGRCDIFPSWYAPRYPDSSKKAVIDTISNKLATECTPEAAKQSISGGGILAELPTSDPMYNNWMRPIQARYGASGGIIPSDKDDVHSCDPADKPFINSLTYDETTKKIVADVRQGKYPLKNVSFKANGQILSGGSFDITTNQKVYYTNKFTTKTTVIVEVVDSVLYSVTSEPIEVPAIPSGGGGSPGGDGGGDGDDGALNNSYNPVAATNSQNYFSRRR
jgi:penicillin-binding protein 1A